MWLCSNNVCVIWFVVGPPSSYLLQGKMNLLSASTCLQYYIDITGYNDVDFNTLYNYSVCAGTYPLDINTCYVCIYNFSNTTKVNILKTFLFNPLKTVVIGSITKHILNCYIISLRCDLSSSKGNNWSEIRYL